MARNSSHYAALFLFAALFFNIAYASDAPSLRALGERLISAGCYSDSCKYEVFLPAMPDPVEYHVDLLSSAQGADSLSPCSYIIRWALDAPSGIVNGFSAYFGGDHYRFANNRLQEYHAAVDTAPFAPGGDVTNGVQRRAQFTELLPQFIGESFLTMETDTTYSVTVSSNPTAVTVRGVRRLAGFDATIFTYRLDPVSYLPISAEFESNPGQISEQSISVHYARAEAAPQCSFTTRTLMQLEPEAFELYRTESYSLEQLVGNPLPRIALPTASGERYIHHQGDAMTATTLLVFVDSSIGSTTNVVSAVRSAIAQVPAAVDVVWMFIDRRADDAVSTVERILPSELLVINAGAAARDLGIGAVTPVIVLVNRSGRVEDFIRGYNKNLESVVIQMATLAAASN